MVRFLQRPSFKFCGKLNCVVEKYTQISLPCNETGNKNTSKQKRKEKKLSFSPPRDMSAGIQTCVVEVKTKKKKNEGRKEGLKASTTGRQTDPKSTQASQEILLWVGWSTKTDTAQNLSCFLSRSSLGSQLYEKTKRERQRERETDSISTFSIKIHCISAAAAAIDTTDSFSFCFLQSPFPPLSLQLAYQHTTSLKHLHAIEEDRQGVNRRCFTDPPHPLQ